MSDVRATPDDANDRDAQDDGSDPEVSDALPDESTLLGATGVEAEVLAELARAEGKMSDPSGAEDPDAAGAQV